MNKRVAFFAVALAIGWSLGAACGLFAARHSRWMPGHGNPKHLEKRLIRDLHLNSEQQARLHGILEAHRQRRDQLFAEVRPKLDALRDSFRHDLRAILTPEQIPLFERLDAELEARRKRFEEKHIFPR